MTNTTDTPVDPDIQMETAPAYKKLWAYTVAIMVTDTASIILRWKLRKVYRGAGQ